MKYTVTLVIILFLSGLPFENIYGQPEKNVDSATLKLKIAFTQMYWCYQGVKDSSLLTEEQFEDYFKSSTLAFSKFKNIFQSKYPIIIDLYNHMKTAQNGNPILACRYLRNAVINFEKLDQLPRNESKAIKKAYMESFGIDQNYILSFYQSETAKHLGLEIGKICTPNDRGNNTNLPDIENIPTTNHDIPIPQFPWPPPKCFQRSTVIDKLTPRFSSFGEIDQRLQQILNVKGYFQRSYFQTPGGFAIVTQLEQFAEDGKTKEYYRWVDYPVRDFEGIWDYLTSLIMPTAGHFRIFVFVVTDRPYTQSPQTASKEDAVNWLSEGMNRMPLNLSKTHVTSNHYLDVLIYEFEAPNSTKKCSPKCPCLLDSQTHLSKSGLIEILSGF